MKLLTKALEKRFSKVGRDENTALNDKIVIAKFFYPMGRQTWYATEYDPEYMEFFGYVSLFGDHNDEWGNFSLAEFFSFNQSHFLGIERDMHWTEKRFGDINLERYS